MNTHATTTKTTSAAAAPRRGGLLHWAGIAAVAIAAASAAAALPEADATPAVGGGPIAMAGIEPAGSPADPCSDGGQYAAAEPNPKLEAEMNARLDSLHDQVTGIMAEYGFSYQVPHLTDEQAAEMHGRLDKAAAAYEHLFDEAASLSDYGPGGGFPPQAVIAAVETLIKDEQDEIMREYGYVISEPRLSAEDEAAMNAKIDAVWKEIDALFEAYDSLWAAPAAGGGTAGCGPGQDHADAEIERLIEPLFDEIDDIMAEYGFVNETPVMSDAEMRLFNAEMGSLADKHARAIKELAWRLAPMLANGSISMSEAFEEDRRLSERTEAEYSKTLAEYGFVIVVPELSAEDEEAMTERLSRVHDRIDAIYAQHAPPYVHEDGGSDGGTSEQ